MSEKLTAEYIERIEPTDGRRESWTVHFAGGKKAKTWSKRCADAIEGKAKGQEAEYDLEAAQKAEWAPKITKVILAGEVLYDLAAGSASSGGWRGGSSGGGRSSNPDERASIEAQVAAKIAADLGGIKATTEGPEAALKFVIGAIPKIAEAIREAAGGRGNPRSSESDSSASPAGSLPKAPSKESKPAGYEALDDVIREREELIDQLQNLGMTKPGILARYNRAFGEANGKAAKIEEIPIDPLAELVAEVAKAQ